MVKEDILIISNYYPPEQGAASNRIELLAEQLYTNNYNVEVLCPLPNYPKGKIFDNYKNKFFVKEVVNHITINRLWLLPSISQSKWIRLFSIFSFSTLLVFYLIFFKTPKKVIIQSPPLLLSFLSVFILKFKQKKIILNVSDLWPLAAIELNALKENSFSHRVSKFFEQFIYKNANIILGQSNEIITHIKKTCSQKSIYLYRNYPHATSHIFNLKTNHNQPIKVFYAGLLGVAQGVFQLCKNVNFDELNIEFHIFGDGAEREELMAFLKEKAFKNVSFHGLVNRHELADLLKNFDIALVPLKNRIYGSVPSKIFEYSSLGFPILYFGGGEGETIVEDNNLGWVVAVADFDQLHLTLKKLSQMDKEKFSDLKHNIYNRAKMSFDISLQIKDLITKEVF